MLILVPQALRLGGQASGPWKLRKHNGVTSIPSIVASVTTALAALHGLRYFIVHHETLAQAGRYLADLIPAARGGPGHALLLFVSTIGALAIYLGVHLQPDSGKTVPGTGLDDYLSALRERIPHISFMLQKYPLSPEANQFIKPQNKRMLYERLKGILYRQSYSEQQLNQDASDFYFLHLNYTDYFKIHPERIYPKSREDMVHLIRDLFDPFFERDGFKAVDLFSGPKPLNLPAEELQGVGFYNAERQYLYGVDLGLGWNFVSTEEDRGAIHDDAMDLALPSDYLDLVTMFHPDPVLFHKELPLNIVASLKTVNPVVAESRRILRPGGWIYIAPHSGEFYVTDADLYEQSLRDMGFINVERVPFPTLWKGSIYGRPKWLIKGQKAEVQPGSASSPSLGMASSSDPLGALPSGSESDVSSMKTMVQRLEQRGLLRRIYVRQSTRIREIVNAFHRPLVGVYGGAGVDFSSYLLATDARNSYFIDENQVYGRFTAITLRALFANPESILLSQEAQDYRKSKFDYGYAHMAWTASEASAHAALLSELDGLGIDFRRVVVEDVEGGVRLQFPWSYPGRNEESYSVTLLNGNLQWGWENLPHLLPAKIGVYYQKAGYGIPYIYSEPESFIMDLDSRMEEGAYYVTDDNTVNGDRGDHFPLPYPVISDQSLSLIETLILLVRQTLSISTWPYGGVMRIRQKVVLPWTGRMERYSFHLASLAQTRVLVLALLKKHTNNFPEMAEQIYQLSQQGDDQYVVTIYAVSEALHFLGGPSREELLKALNHLSHSLSQNIKFRSEAIPRSVQEALNLSDIHLDSNAMHGLLEDVFRYAFKEKKPVEIFLADALDPRLPAHATFLSFVQNRTEGQEGVPDADTGIGRTPNGFTTLPGMVASVTTVLTALYGLQYVIAHHAVLAQAGRYLADLIPAIPGGPGHALLFFVSTIGALSIYLGVHLPPNGATRRTFLGASGVAAAAGLVPGTLSGQNQNSTPRTPMTQEMFQKIISGVLGLATNPAVVGPGTLTLLGSLEYWRPILGTEEAARIAVFFITASRQSMETGLRNAGLEIQWLTPAQQMGFLYRQLLADWFYSSMTMADGRQRLAILIENILPLVFQEQGAVLDLRPSLPPGHPSIRALILHDVLQEGIAKVREFFAVPPAIIQNLTDALAFSYLVPFDAPAEARQALNRRITFAFMELNVLLIPWNYAFYYQPSTEPHKAGLFGVSIYKLDSDTYKITADSFAASARTGHRVAMVEAPGTYLFNVGGFTSQVLNFSVIDKERPLMLGKLVPMLKGLSPSVRLATLRANNYSFSPETAWKLMQRYFMGTSDEIAASEINDLLTHEFFHSWMNVMRFFRVDRRLYARLKAMAPNEGVIAEWFGDYGAYLGSLAYSKAPLWNLYNWVRIMLPTDEKDNQRPFGGMTDILLRDFAAQVGITPEQWPAMTSPRRLFQRDTLPLLEALSTVDDETMRIAAQALFVNQIGDLLPRELIPTKPGILIPGIGLYRRDFWRRWMMRDSSRHSRGTYELQKAA